MKFRITGLPIYTLSKYFGMGDAVQRLRIHGLVQSLEGSHVRIVEGGDVALPKLIQDIGPSNLRNYEEFIQASERIASHISGLENEEERFLFLGGECSLIVGAATGLQKMRRRTLGVLWLDSHGDFNTPETTPSGFIGGMCLAMACGRGPKLSPTLEAHRPAVRAEHVTHAASRNLDPPERVEMNESAITLLEMRDLRTKGVIETLSKALKGLEDASDEFILHVDIDCTDPKEIPAVSFPEPGGLSLIELRQILALCAGSERLKAVDLAAYNASRDERGISAKRIIEAFAKGLGA